jgi:hypothetical protein
MARSGKQHRWWRKDENVVILNRGAVTFGIPRSWTVEGKAEGLGYLNLTDPSDSCSLQISCLNMPPMPGPPPIDEMLRDVAVKTHPSASLAPISRRSRGSVESAWLDCSYGEQDTERDEWRQAHARLYFACNLTFGALLTFYYWEDDTEWAVAAFERVVETLQLGDRGLLRSDPAARRN